MQPDASSYEYFHVAPSECRARIAADGIEARDPGERWSIRRTDQPPGVYLWADLASAQAWAADQDLQHALSDGAADIWRVLIPEQDVDEWVWADPAGEISRKLARSWVWVDEDGIPPQWLQLVA